MTASIYDTITAQIIAAIEAGAATFHMPWHRSAGDIAAPMNRASGKAYRGINTLALWAAAEARGYGAGLWATYRQWAAIGAHVRKGEKAAAIVFWKDFRTGQADDSAISDERGRAFVARGYSVFNADQVDARTCSGRSVRRNWSVNVRFSEVPWLVDVPLVSVVDCPTAVPREEPLAVLYPSDSPLLPPRVRDRLLVCCCYTRWCSTDC